MKNGALAHRYEVDQKVFNNPEMVKNIKEEDMLFEMAAMLFAGFETLILLEK